MLGIGAGAGVGYAVLTAAGALDVRAELPLLGSYPVLTALPAATALLLLWSGRRPRLGSARYGAAAVVFVGMPVIYFVILPLGLALNHATWTKPESAIMADGMPAIGFGPAAAVGLLLLHLVARPAREDATSRRMQASSAAAASR
ncbi:MAG: hypothetical protein ACRDSR_12075 [Pseudonocardiaceae bacterium]